MIDFPLAGTVVALPGRSGTLRVRWRLALPGPSYERTVAAYVRAAAAR